LDALGVTAGPVRHSEPSLLLSLDDEPWQPSARLLKLAAELARTAPGIVHPLLASRSGAGPRWYEQFPGEHYHLLTALCRLLRPSVVWEFGTDTGMSTLALLEGLGPSALLFTVDIDPWESKNGAWLVDADFASGHVRQLVSDMSAPELFADHKEIIAGAELIFVDGPKDGAAEDLFLEHLSEIAFRRSPIVVFDDIRLMNMVNVWRGIARPKMDLTSFGHWSGTGLVDWG
jgi:predicted O-methyltransferase YrrM